MATHGTRASNRANHRDLPARTRYWTCFVAGRTCAAIRLESALTIRTGPRITRSRSGDAGRGAMVAGHGSRFAWHGSQVAGKATSVSSLVSNHRR